MPNWNQVLQEVHNAQAQGRYALDTIRRHYLQKLNKHTNRNIIAYYSGWLSKPTVAQTDINDEDKNGFMMAVHRLDRTKGLDLILHTPGGNIAATQSIVQYLQEMFANDIRAIVPQIAMSAGTMIACSCKEILMGKQSNLGPIDPHIRNIPTFGVIEEFQRAIREIKADPTTLPVWQQIIGQYRPTFLGQCEKAIKWSGEFVENQLSTVMFAGEARAKSKAKKAVRALSDYTKNLSHDRHIPANECEKLGLKIFYIEQDQKLQDLILTVHHCYMHVFMNTNAFKIIENHLGAALVKQQALVQHPALAPAGAVPE